MKKDLKGQRPIVNGEIYPRIGLAIGSGAAKAVCQFGLLKRLKENNIKISFITGSSMGAVLGAIFALDLDLGFSFEKAYRYAEVANINNLTNFNFFHESLYNKSYTDNMLTEVFSDFTFEDCKIPLTVTAVDLETGKIVLLDKGPLAPAVRASTSIPGIFEPVLMDEKYLVDGGLLEDCPVSVLRKQYPCDIIIGSHITAQTHQQAISGQIFKKFYKKSRKKGLFISKIKNIKNDVSLLGSIMIRSLEILRAEVWKCKLEKAKPDIMLEMNIEKVSAFEFKKMKKILKIGEKAFDKKEKEIKMLINQKKKELNR